MSRAVAVTCFIDHAGHVIWDQLYSMDKFLSHFPAFLDKNILCGISLKSSL